MPRTASLRPLGKTHPDETRRSNRRLLLQEVFDAGPLSRADVARSTALSRATVSEISTQLLAEGLLVETGLGESTGGKPPIMMELDPDGRFTVAVDLSRHPIESALLNLRGRIVATARGKSLSPQGQDVIEETHRLISHLIGAANAPALGVGIGVPGAVDRNGLVVRSDLLGWESVDLREQIEDIYEVPAYIASDAEVAAVAEFGRGESDSGSNVLYVKVDDRIAVGTITADRLNRTAKHGGDLTHLAIPGWDLRCSCGRAGCLGTRVSMIQILGPDYLGMSTEGRERLAAETAPKVDEASFHLGEALAATVVALDIDRVVIGGQLAGWPSVPEHVAAGIDAVAGWTPQVSTSALGSSAVVLGSAAMVLSGELGVVWT